MIIAISADKNSLTADFENTYKIIFFETENSLIISETEFIPKNLDTDYISSEFKSKSAEVYICQGIKDETKEIFLNLGTEVVHNVSIPARDAAVTYLCGKKLGISEMR